MTANEERAGHTLAESMLSMRYAGKARCVYFGLGRDVAPAQPPNRARSWLSIWSGPPAGATGADSRGR